MPRGDPAGDADDRQGTEVRLRRAAAAVGRNSWATRARYLRHGHTRDRARAAPVRRRARRCPRPPSRPRAQKLFRKRLLNDRGVSTEVKRVLRNGGFVDRDIRFGDVTGDGKSDALVLVNEGGSAGPDRAVRLQLAQAAQQRRRRWRRAADPLQGQSLYRARASLKQTSAKRPQRRGRLQDPGLRPRRRAERPGRDATSSRSAGAPRRSRFGVPRPATVDRVRSRFCPQTGDYCTETIKSKRGASTSSSARSASAAATRSA